MASSGKFDLSSVSPDRPLYNSAQRGSYTAASLDRSSSFRENMENPILSSLPSMSRSTSTVTQVDVTNFLHCLRFDPKLMAAEHKFNRHGDFKRLASAVLGSPDASPSGSSKGKLPSSSPEDLKRLKAGLRESTIKARERVKVFSETLSVINKCFPSIPSRKRSRPDALPGDRSSGLLLNRAPTGPGVGKMGTQSHSLTSAFDFEPQKVEERGKNAIPNKRTRTSMVDQRAEVRPNTPARSAGNVDRDKEVLRLPNSNALQGDDRALPIVADGWEKAKMKKKRTGIKVDAAPSPSSVSTKAIDGYREPKQGMHPRHLPDAMSRLNDSHGFRPGAANGVVGGGKADGSSQQASVGIRSSIPRPEQENTSLLHDKRDRSTSSEKERTNLRSINKSNVREEFISGSPTSSTKMHATARGPRSGSNIVPKSSTVVQRATASSDWELTHGTNKNPGAFGSSNRKRTPSTRSSSPPVAQWADRRPQKISRTARRTNLVPILSNNDEVPALDTSDVTGSESGAGFGKRFPANSPSQFKSKGDHFPSSTLSESEESGAAEIRSRDKGKKSDEVEEKAEPNVQKMSTLVLPTRKNKMVNGEDMTDGVRRQGRTGRGYGSARAVTPMTVDKIRNPGTAKQLRTARLGFDKSESKSGRPPTRKLSDRKAYTRQKHTAINAAEYLVASGDGHEELLAAANAVINPNHALSSPFWRQMEPLFRFVSDMDMSYLKQQGSIQSTITTNNPVHLRLDSSGTLPNGTDSRSIEPSPERFAPETASPGEIPLCQRLLAALISEEGNDELPLSGSDAHKFNVYGSGFEFETDVESNAFNHRSLKNFELGGHGTFGGHRINSALRSCNEPMHSPSNNHIMSVPDSTISTGFDHSYNGLLSDPAMMSGITISEYQYGNMSINERLLIEIQSIGLYPELVPDLPCNGNEDIGGELSRLEEKHHEQVSRKKSLLDNLLKSTNEARERQEKEFEQLCLDKLTSMAFQKYMSCWGPHAPGGKSVGGKMAKQAALAFMQQTLDRCHEFGTTGKSCFAEPLYREMLRSGSSHLNDAQIDVATDGEFGKVYGNSIERVSGAQLSPSLNNHDIYSSDAFHSSEQTFGKADIWSSRVKNRELYLDDVVAGTSSGAPSGIGTTILNSAKGKRSDRDREGKGNGREVLSRNGAPKIGRPASGNVKGERKAKTKLKQKTTQLSASLNGPIGKISDQHRPTMPSVPKPVEMKNNIIKEKDDYKLLENSEEPLDFSHLQIPEMDVLGDDLGEQGQDIGSWLNIDEEILQDDDFMGLEIPMDDLSDLNMMV
ncbi:hypothetical protein Ccrd_009354 [Cynara cardunculus var. scolymus]|uniref:Uncharacterized protein n=1 Tax=Cynara cardunculus var. scolymus TaxID=59895 RepID=A0A103YND9_CYNCS|nr:hypothetical protein Ccrd_009354 [Cynara cardunculus var. scolymus]